MLRKLIKHEFRATSRIMWPIFAGMLALTLVMRAAMYMTNRYWGGFDTARFFSTLYSLLFLAYIFGLAALCLAPLVLSAVRFRNHILRDEGYLTLTLPVSIHRLLLSKLIVSAVWYAAAFLVMALTMLVVSTTWSDLRTFPALFGDLFSAFSQLEDSLRSGAMLLILQIFLACVLGVIVSTLIVYAAYAVGYSFNRHKSAITAVLLLVFYQLVQIAGLRLTFGVADSERFSQAWSAHAAMSFAHSFFTMALVGELVSCAIFYLITWYFTTRKLNLE